MIEFDATNQKLGRLASEIAKIIIGKHRPEFVPYKVVGEEVVIKHADKIVMTGKKAADKKYFHHTGYIGHLRTKKVKDFSPAELIKMAVWRMLPKTRLRTERIKLLKFV